MKIKFNHDTANCYALLFLFALYLSQPILGTQGILGIPILLVVVLISIYYLAKYTVRICRESVTAIFWLLFFFYNTFFFLLSSNVLEYSEYRQIVLNMLPFFAFYYFAEKGILNERVLKVFFVAMLLIFCVSFFSYSHILAERTGREEFTNNVSYLVLGLLPFVFLFRNALIRSGLILILSWFALTSSKRAVLIMCLFAIAIILYGFILENKGRKRIKGILLAGAFFYLFAFVAIYYYNHFGIGDRFEERLYLMIYEGDSAGRDSLFLDLYNTWLNSNDLLVYLFGLGYRAAVDVTGSVTHNDLIKSLGEGGIVGLLLFISVVASLCLNWFNSFSKPKHRLSYAVLICSMVISIATSRWYGSSFFYMNCVLLPYLLVSQSTFRKKP